MVQALGVVNPNPKPCAALAGTIPLSISGLRSLVTLDLTGNAMSLKTGQSLDWATIAKARPPSSLGWALDDAGR